MELTIDIKKEQEKAQEQIKEQGYRVLVCGGTGCVANGSEKVMQKFRDLGANVSTLSDYDKLTVIPTGCHGFCEQGVLVILPDQHTAYVKEANNRKYDDQRPFEHIQNDHKYL